MPMSRLQFLSVLFTVAFAPVSWAQDMLPQPSGTVVLTLSGTIEHTNVGDEAHFDLEMLKAIGGKELNTETIWTEGVQNFVGVDLYDILARVEAQGSALEATAINDYTIEIPMEDAVEGGAFVAYARNGRAMSLRDKGPLWIVYPFDEKPRYKSETFHARSIWQLDRLKVLP